MAVDSLVLISGGLDSMVLAHKLTNDKKSVRGMYFNFKTDVSPHELESVKKTTYRLGIPLEVVDVGGLPDLLFGHAPLKYLMASAWDTLGDWRDWGYYVVASGYSVQLSIATHYAQLAGIGDIQVAVIGDQRAAHPNLEAYFAAWPKTIALLNDRSPGFTVSAPFLKKTKADVVKLGASLRAPLAESWSCFRSGVTQCGECSACEARKKAFVDAGVKDDTKYRN